MSFRLIPSGVAALALCFCVALAGCAGAGGSAGSHETVHAASSAGPGDSVGPAGGMALVKDGQPAATIVIRDSALGAKPFVPDVSKADVPSPDAKVRLAANDFQAYIQKISGVKLPIVGESQVVHGTVVLIGNSKRVEALKLGIPRGVTYERLEEGFVIHAKGDTLVLAGNEDGMYWGTYYAVAECLNDLGVRWFMPAEFGEVVPSFKTIRIGNTDRHEKPDFAMRTWWGYLPPEQANQEVLWKLRNKMQIFSLMDAAGDSSLRQWLPESALVKTHPEYFGTGPDGKPDPYNVNYSNPDIAHLVAVKMKAYYKETIAKTGHPPSAMAIAPDDGMPVDYTPESQKLNQGFTEIVGRDGMPSDLSISEEWFTFVNKVATEVCKEYPEAIIASNGYANRNLPPEGITLHPNISIEYASIWADTLKALNSPLSWHSAVQAACIKRWCELNKRVYQYRYVYTMLGTNLAPVPTTRKLAYDMPFYKKCGFFGFTDEQKPAAWMEQGITTFYIRARTYWDADLNVKATLDDYFDKWYGSAADPARAFWDALEDRMQSAPILGHEQRILPYVYTPELIAELEKDCALEEKLADTERAKVHVAIDRHTLEHLKDYLDMWEAEFSAKYELAAHQCDLMTAERARLHDISPFLNQPELGYEAGLNRYWSGTWGEGVTTSKKPAYLKLNDNLNGKTGDLVAMGDRQTRFTLDIGDRGKTLRWYDPGFDRSQWQTVDTTKPYYLQVPRTFSSDGIPYSGYMWYAFDMKVPGSFKGKTIKLYSQVVVTEAWVWVNGQYAGHRGYHEPCDQPAELDLDVTPFIKAGQTNTVAVRVSTSTNRTQEAEGFQSRLMLWSPKPGAMKTAAK